MEISIKWNLCRVCLQEEPKIATNGADQMQHIFNDDKKLSQSIYEFAGVIMKPNDSLPDKICRKCVSIINNAVQFRKTCRASNVYLLSILERTKLASIMFKPALPKCSERDEDLEKIETEPSNIQEKELESKDHDKETHGKEEQTQNLVSSKKGKIEKVKNSKQQERHAEQEFTDQSNNKSSDELEEIIELPEELDDQLFNQSIEEDNTDEVNSSNKHLKEEYSENSDSNSENAKTETSQLQKFYMNASFSKSKNTEEDPEDDPNDNEETEADNLNTNNEELYKLFNDVKKENFRSNNIENEEDLEDNEDQLSNAEENLEYFAIEEEEDIDEDGIGDSFMLHLEEKVVENDNQAHVSSTVDTNDEFEYQEQNSNTSNLTSDFEEEFIVNDNSINYIAPKNKTCSQLSESHTLEIAPKSSQAPKKKRSTPIIFPAKRARQHNMKSAASNELQASVCDICGNQFTNRNQMKIHMKVHFQEKNHQCELCFKRFITACNLQAHMRIHTGEKPFECKYCSRRFNDRTSNLRHERTHTNEKPFECANCGKCFALGTTLQNHMKVHTNDRSYRCEPCGKSFKLAHHLKTHLNTTLHRSVLQIQNDDN